MTVGLPTLLADAWRLFRRDRGVLVPIAAALMFVPAFGLQLFVPPPPPLPPSGAEETVRLAWAEAATAWLGAWGGWYLAAYSLLYWGAATVVSFYGDPRAGTVADALRRSLRLLPRYLLAMLMVTMASGLGLLLFVLPGLYVMGRVLVTGPVLVAERPIGAARAVARAVTLSRGHGLPLMAVAGLSVLVKWVCGSPMVLAAAWLREQDGGNVVAVAIVAAGAGAVVATAELGLALAAAVAYRRLARSGT